jgi:dTDP-glucose pyrophosphorylase
MKKELKHLKTFEQNTDKNLNISDVINRLTESSKLTKTLRKLGWFGDTWTPQEYKTQIRNLSDETLLLWYNSKDTPIPNTPLDFQHKLVKLEVERRGLDK